MKEKRERREQRQKERDQLGDDVSQLIRGSKYRGPNSTPSAGPSKDGTSYHREHSCHGRDSCGAR